MHKCTRCGAKYSGEEISEMRAEHEEFSLHPFICPDCWDDLQHSDPVEQVKELINDKD